MLRLLGILSLSSLLVCAASVAAAQPSSRFYAGAALGVFRVSADEVSGISPAGSAVGGVALAPWVDIEVDVARPTSSFTRTYGGDRLSVSFAPSGSSREEIERFGIWLRYDHRRDVTASISTVAIFHPSAGTIRPGLIIGVTSQHLHDRTDYTPTKIGPAVDPSHRYASPYSETASHIEGALTLGVNVALTVNRHISVVPDLRYDYGSIGDEINNALRSSVRVLWRF
jgi:outer membrane protein with beta-barrel domain